MGTKDTKLHKRIYFITIKTTGWGRYKNVCVFIMVCINEDINEISDITYYTMYIHILYLYTRRFFDINNSYEYLWLGI